MKVTQDHRHARVKGRCPICRTPVPADVVCCAPCGTEYFMLADQLEAENLMREALKAPGFREAVAKLCATAAIKGAITLRWKHGKFYRAEFPK